MRRASGSGSLSKRRWELELMHMQLFATKWTTSNHLNYNKNKIKMRRASGSGSLSKRRWELELMHMQLLTTK